MKYYGYIISELFGYIENIEGEYNYKPPIESVGFSICKWFKTEEERDKRRSLDQITIQEYRNRRNKKSPK